MRGKRITALLLALGMVVTAVAGCSNKEAGSTTNNNDTQNAADTANDTQTADDEDDEEMADITVALLSLSALDTSATKAVEEKINEITEKEINVHVNIQWNDAGTYDSAVAMMIQGGDKLDLMMFTPLQAASYTSFMSAGQLLDISELLNEYGQDVLEIQGDLINACALNGGIYGVGHYRDLAAFQNICVRKDVLEEVGRLEDAENASSWSDVESIMKDITAAGYTGFVNCDVTGNVLYPSGFDNGADAFADNKSVDILGDGYQLIFTDADTNTVECEYFTDSFEKMSERIANWYKEGLVYKDAASSQDYGDTLLRSEVGVAKVAQQGSGSLENMKASAGHEFVGIKVSDMMITTSSVTKFGYAVPVTAKEPEAAIKFLNLLYTSSDVMNTLTWGVEGRDWVMTDDGHAAYPEGVTSENVSYHAGDFLYGNMFITAQWENSVTPREEQKKATDATEISKYFGFQIDNTGLENTVTACYNVKEQYMPILYSGISGDKWKATLTEFQNALKAAGIDELIAAYQEQLDNWLAQQ